MRKVLLVQPSLQPPGGSNAVAAWMLQALVPLHEVTVLSWRPVDVDAINRFFGTSLRRADFKALVVPRSWRSVPDAVPTPASLVKSSLLMRYTRRVSDGYDVILGAHNETDFGRRGIQYIHYPTYLRPRPTIDLRWYHRPQALLHAYYRAADRLADFSLDRLRCNLTLANSNWTAAHVRRFLDVNVQTLYPPVAAPADPRPWAERARRFLAVGRIAPEKEYERTIRILAEVRRHVPGISLIIAGTHDRYTAAYYLRLRRQAAAVGSWIEFRENLPHDDIRTLMASSRYGLHSMREEHFGMAPAELARAGALVWVPNGGGQVEIVGEPELVLDEEAEAADRIAATISDPARERRLRDSLGARAEGFSTARFSTAIRSIVAEFRA